MKNNQVEFKELSFFPRLSPFLVSRRPFCYIIPETRPVLRKRYNCNYFEGRRRGQGARVDRVKEEEEEREVAKVKEEEGMEGAKLKGKEGKIRGLMMKK